MTETQRRNGFDPNDEPQSPRSLPPRRVPGSGIIGKPRGAQAASAPSLFANAPIRPRPQQSSQPRPQRAPRVGGARPSFDFVSFLNMLKKEWQRAPFFPRVPKQWRVLSVVAMAALFATISFESHLLATHPVGETQSASVSSPQESVEATPRVMSAMVDLELPEIKNVDLPPIPVRKEGVREPHLAASSVLLIDDVSKTRLYDKNADKRISVASTTKVMTALVALDLFADDLDTPIKISLRAVNQIGSAVGFRHGESATMRQLLHGLLISSGNDAAAAISEQVSGGDGPSATANFVSLMNEKAVKLGMTDTRFQDPAGLNDDGYSTPADMAKAMSELLKHPLLLSIIGKLNYTYSSSEGYQHDLLNSNRLIGEMYYPGILGGKTGFTPKTPEGGAGHCLIVAAKRDGHTLIAAVFDTHNSTPQASAQVAREALEYGFGGFTWQSFAR